MKLAVQKRTRCTHLVNEEMGTTLCGHTLYRRSWRIRTGAARECVCKRCWRVVAARHGLQQLMPNRWAGRNVA